jgi:putative phosphoribosyl transferase
MIYGSRRDAGHRLGEFLLEKAIEADLILGLPRGGVVVAAEVARVLRLPLDVLVVRKVGHPWNREFAVGAMAEGDAVVLDEEHLPEQREEINRIIEEEKRRLQDYQSKFHRGGLPELAGKQVILVDDGLATGSTMEAAVVSAKKRHAKRVLVAVPVASPSAEKRIARVADQVLPLMVDPGFMAVGQYYASFVQTTDEEVLELLNETGLPE